jgi:indolepyruvate decarboxylase
VAYNDSLDYRRVITVDLDFVRIGEDIYNPVQLKDVIAGIAGFVQAPSPPYQAPGRDPVTPEGEKEGPINVKSLYSRYAHFIREGDIVVVETGSQGAIASPPSPDRCTYISQVQWGSIGYATGCAFGTAIAAPGRRTVLFTGEGSHQMTVNDLGNMSRYGAKPVIFVLNNSGYMIERALERSPDRAYNDLAPWNYTSLPAAFGCKDWFTARAATNGELAFAMEKAQSHQGASYIEIISGRLDYPGSLKILNAHLMKMYGFNDEREMP